MSTESEVRRAKGVYDVFFALALFAITALTVYPLFYGDFTRNWVSVESVFYVDAQFIASNYPHVGWIPYWYSGAPFRSLYPPLLPYAVALLHTFANWSVGHAYRVITGLAYSAIPAALYLLAKYLSKDYLTGIAVGLTYSLVPTFDPAIASHIDTLALYGEGPHIFALLFCILAIVQLFRCFNKPTWPRYITMAVLVAIVALTDFVGFFGFVIMALVALLTEIMNGQPLTAIRTFLLALLISYGLVAFQYNWEFIAGPLAFAQNELGTSGFSILQNPLLPMGIVFIVPLCFIALRLVQRRLSRFKNAKAFFFAFCTIVVFAAIVLGKQILGWTFAPQTTRYVPELDVGISLLIGLIVGACVNALPRISLPHRRVLFRSLQVFLVGVVLLALLLTAQTLLLPNSLEVTMPSASVVDSPEYHIASWLSTHMTEGRVYATGSPAFWLDVFSNVEQIRGGSDQGATNKWWAAVTYQINNGSNVGVSILWAKALNVKYIVVVFPNASTAFHDYARPDEFKSVLPLRFYYEGFGIYEIPFSQTSLVQAVSARSARQLAPISDVLDTHGLSDYLGLLDSSPGVQVLYDRPTPDQLIISVSNASVDTAILVKMTFDPRWTAEVNGSPLQIWQFGPDFMVVCPRMAGTYQITMSFGFSSDELLGYFLTGATFIAMIVVASAMSFRAYSRRVREMDTHADD